MSSHDPYRPPEAALEQVDPHGCWREGRYVVLTRAGDLPLACFTCGEPLDRPAKDRRLEHLPWWMLVGLPVTCAVGPLFLVWLLVALFIRHPRRVRIGWCARHRRRYRVRVLSGLALVLASAVVALTTSAISPAGTVVAIAMFLLAIVLFATARREPRLRRVGGGLYRVSGMGSEALARLSSTPLPPTSSPSVPDVGSS